jgi:hypothetical protein
MLNLATNWFSARWAEAQNRAGRRYSQELNVALPIADYIEASRQDQAFSQAIRRACYKSSQKSTPTTRLVGTVTVANGDDSENRESLLFLRRDLLDAFLIRRELTLIQFVWGERRANYHNRG